MGILLNAARTAATDDILSVRDVGRLLSTALEDGKISRGERTDLEKLKTEFSNELSPAARKAINSFLAMGDTFDGNLAGQVFGLTTQQGDQLERAGVRTVGQLMIASRTPEGRQKLAAESRLNVLTVTNFAEKADLARVIGVGNKFAALLHGVGINNVGELADKDPTQLRRQILDFMRTDAGQAITTRRPSLVTVTRWCERASALPQILKYMGENGPNFDKAAFNRLPDPQKAMLLFGYDVRVGDGVFEHENLSISVPRRKPRAVTDFIAAAENTGFQGDYDHVHLSSVERIKAKDETLGYRLTFDVSGTEAYDYEGVGDIDVEGWVEVALDADGKFLDSTADVWPGGNYEG